MTLSARFRLRRGAFVLDVGLELPARGVTGITGPSGCGKTTFLRAVAGLEDCLDARLVLDGDVWQDGGRGRPVHERGVGYVFQHAALFPHLDVSGNLEYGRRRSGEGRTVLTRDEAVEMLGLDGLLDRRCDRLSGGERQRVALARALLAGPRLLLLDEPLAALDETARDEILPRLERVFRAAGVPVLYVSHALDEVARLSDHVVCMDGGGLVAHGPASDMLTRLDLPLARADAAEALLDGVVLEHDAADHLTALDVPGGVLWVPRSDLAPGRRVRARILARDVSLALGPRSDCSILNVLKATVGETAPAGESQVLVRLDCGGAPLLSRITRRSARTLAVEPGRQFYAQVKSVALLA